MPKMHYGTLKETESYLINTSTPCLPLIYTYGTKKRDRLELLNPFKRKFLKSFSVNLNDLLEN